MVGRQGQGWGSLWALNPWEPPASVVGLLLPLCLVLTSCSGGPGSPPLPGTSRSTLRCSLPPPSIVVLAPTLFVALALPHGRMVACPQGAVPVQSGNCPCTSSGAGPAVP